MSLPEFLSSKKQSDNFFKSVILKNIILQNYENIEIEARFGKISNLITKKRINFDVNYPIVFNRLPDDCFFDSGVDKYDFENIKNVIISSDNSDDIKSVNDKIATYGKIRRIESDENIKFEKKIRLKTIDIYFPNQKYDIRICLSRETSVDSKEFKGPVNFLRKRERQSLVFGQFSFDFTKVIKETEKSFEIEFEIKENVGESLNDFLDVVFNLTMIKK